MDLNKVKDTIAAMLNLAANDSASQGEVDNAMRFAAKLMEQHQLTEEDVKLNKVDEKILNLETAEFDKVSSYAFGGSESLQRWNSDAASFACEFVGGVKWYYTSKVPYKINGIQQTNRNGKTLYRTRMTFYGIAEDVAIANQVYEELCMTIVAMAKLRFGAVYRGSGLSYCEGFVTGLWDKWHSDKHKQRKLAITQGSTSTALVVIDKRYEIVARKTELAKQWLKQGAGIDLGKGKATRGRSNVDVNAHKAGATDGSQYNAKGEPKAKLNSPTKQLPNQ